MSGHLLSVRWKAGIDFDKKHVRWLVAPFWPKLQKKISVAYRRTVRSLYPVTDVSPEHIRHELHHVWQFAQWLPWWPWMGAQLFRAWYWINPRFRKRVERDAEAHEGDEFPEWRVIRPL